MSDTNLRSSLIKLAHSNPELRPMLLPLLKEAAKKPEGAGWEKTGVQGGMRRKKGDNWEYWYPSHDHAAKAHREHDKQSLNMKNTPEDRKLHTHHMFGAGAAAMYGKEQDGGLVGEAYQRK